MGVGKWVWINQRNDGNRLKKMSGTRHPIITTNEGEEDGNSGDESVDKCDSESDDDDEVVAFVDESDSEMEVPVNTPGLVVLVHELAGYLYLIRAT